MGDMHRLVEENLLQAGATLTWNRRSGQTHTAKVNADGSLETPDGRTHKTPSGAARHLIGRPIDGWNVWCAPDGARLSQLRSQLGQGTNG